MEMDIDQPTNVNVFVELHKKLEEMTPPTINALVNGVVDISQSVQKLKSLAKHANLEPKIMLRPYIRTVSQFIVTLLPFDPSGCDLISELFDHTTQSLMKANMEYVVPFAAFQENNEYLIALTQLLSTTPSELLNYCATFIIVALLMMPDPQEQESARIRIERTARSRNLIENLQSRNQTQITTALALKLGIPDEKDQAILALTKMKSKSLDKMDLSTYLTINIIAILEKVTQFIQTKKYDPKPAILSLQEVMKLIGPDNTQHAVHLTKVFYMVGNISGMELDAIELWKCFIETLDYDGVKSHLLIILQGLVKICCHSSTFVRHTIAETIMTILSDHEEDLDQLPDFPTLPELDAVRQFIADKVDMTPEVQMKKAYDRLFDPDETSVLIGVKKLSMLLTNDMADSERYLTQLLYVSQKYAYQPTVMYYVSICLGKLGAVDPNRVNVDIKDDTIYVLEDFKSTAENQQFICRIIMDCILPAFNAAEEKELPFVYYSIQTLLHDAGFTTVETMKQKKYQSTLQLWLKFPPSTQELLAPFLRSSYKSSQVQSTIEYPIYPQSSDVDTWVRLWYYALEKWSIGAAKKIFAACLPVVLHGNTKVTAYLLPHLVHHIILSAPATETQHVIEEILSVLEIETEKRALEVVVSITQHCRQSLYKNPTRLGKINRFLESIPDKLMAKASFRAKAYPQALMHLETYIKAHPEAIADTTDILPLLSQTYGHLDMKADLDILVGMYSGNMFSTAELICAESLGQWDLAIIHYKDYIERKPDDIDTCLKYLRCLKKAGNLVSVFFEADCYIKRHPEWLPQLNACKMDAAWRIGNYELLEELAKIPSTETHDTFVAQILHFMKQNKSFNMAYYLERARRELASQLGAGSYYKLYPTLFNLQILQEIEDSLTQNPQALALDVKMISPQFNYTHELLQVRKAILYDMKSMPGSASIWLDIAKQSRKNGNIIIALNCILNAERESGEYYYRERAKLEWAKGMRTKAVRLLLEKAKDMVPEDYMLLNSFYLKDPTLFDKMRAERYMMMGLQCTKKAEKAFNQITRFHLIHVEDLNPILARIKNYSSIIRYGLKSLSLGTKYYYSTMSNIINSWFKVVNLVESLNENDNLTQARQILEEINKRIKIAVQVMPVYMFGKFFTRLISHLTIQHRGVSETLSFIIERLFTAYPRQNIWLLLGPFRSETALLSEKVRIILKRAVERNKGTIVHEIIKQALELQKNLDQLSKYQHNSRTNTLDLREVSTFSRLLEMKNLSLAIPSESNLFPQLPEVIDSPNFEPFSGDAVTIKEILPHVTVMKSMQQPKRISFLGSDGNTYHFLCKANDDLRKDARMMEFNYMINSFLRKSPVTRDSDLYIRTYAVVPLGDSWGLIEWINNILPLKTIISDMLQAKGIDFPQMQGIYRAKRGASKLTPSELMTLFNNIKKSCPPVLHQWFAIKFPEPNQWFKSHLRYIKTLAVMSIVGFILGLGDRHAENILFDYTNGDIVHVDLNMLFDHGKRLTVPEVVPFRLTQNLIDAMGVVGYKGLFLKTCEETIKVLVDNKEALVGVFRTLYNEWGSDEKAERTMNLLERRFKEASQPNQASTLAALAADNTSLAGMFPGWAAYL